MGTTLRIVELSQTSNHPKRRARPILIGDALLSCIQVSLR